MSHPDFGGPWTREKLEILRSYLDAYTTALKNQPFNLIYIDAFAGSGWYRTGDDRGDYGEYEELQQGSANIALEIGDRPFDRLVFVERDSAYVESLKQMKAENPERDIIIYNDDANYVIPRVCQTMSSSDRAVMFLDPYATEVSWEMVEAIAETRKIDCWILFPLMAITRMMPIRSEPDESLKLHLDRVFGGREFWMNKYEDSAQFSLFDQTRGRERAHGSEQIANAYKIRLQSAFARVAPNSRTLRNAMGAPLFQFMFAASNVRGAPTAIRIADHILSHL